MNPINPMGITLSKMRDAQLYIPDFKTEFLDNLQLDKGFYRYHHPEYGSFDEPVFTQKEYSILCSVKLDGNKLPHDPRKKEVINDLVRIIKSEQSSELKRELLRLKDDLSL